MIETKPSIFSVSSEDLSSSLRSLGQPSYRIGQLLDWLYTQRVFDLNKMSNIPRALKEQLANQYSFELPVLQERIDSEDGASKLLVCGSNPNQVYESVILRYDNRVSLCVSSQVGCKLSCSFCQTGKLGFFRNLKSSEILGQFALAQSLLHAENRNITHVVFMGMGEPLDNYDAVINACRVLTGSFGISRKRVTVSTSGIAPKIGELAGEGNVSLALSLHACNDALRSELMPINRKYPLSELKDALLGYQRKTQDKITIEYILIADKNCSILHAKELLRFLSGLKVKVNLIPFNEHPGLEYKRPSEKVIQDFQKYLSNRGVPAPVRYSKGLAVSAACGQLAAKRVLELDAEPLRKRVISSVVVS